MNLDSIMSSSSLQELIQKQESPSVALPSKIAKLNEKKQKQIEKEKQNRNARRKRNKENKRAQKQNAKGIQQIGALEEQSPDDDIEIEYVPAPLDNAEFRDIFEKFEAQVASKNKDQAEENKGEDVQQEPKESQEAPDEETEAAKEMTKKQRKMQNRMSIFDLKMLSRRPDLVETWDTTASDPLFLLEMKQARNSVPVPPHWSQKRRYLQYKRGIHKRPFKLPSFIEGTGINRLRAKDDDTNKSLKQRMRERIQPKMGKIDIDYSILHDAFFKHQNKAEMTKHGEIYFEGKENEVTDTKFKPGRLSKELSAALGVPEGSPPPWIINMQRYGPPPAYPNLKVPGVNIPIPESLKNRDATEGGLFEDERGFTVYADSHGLNKAVYQRRMNLKQHWGELDDAAQEEEIEAEEESNEYEDSSEELIDDEEVSDEEETQPAAENDLFTVPRDPNHKPSLEELKSGISSLINGGPSESKPAEKKDLYQVLTQVKSKVGDGDLYGTNFTYQMPAQHQDEEEQIHEKQEFEKPKDIQKKKKELDFKF